MKARATPQANPESRAALATSGSRARKAESLPVPVPSRGVNILAPCPDIPNPTQVRQWRTFAAWENAQRAWMLYKKTAMPMHGWDAYRAWRKYAPADIPLPKELLGFLDEQAAKPANARAQKHAAAQTRIRDALERVRDGAQHAMYLGTEPDYPSLYAEAARRVGIGAAYVKRKASEWGIHQGVKEWAKDEAPRIAARKREVERSERLLASLGDQIHAK